MAAEQSYKVQEKKSNWEVSIARTKAELARAEQGLTVAMRTADLNAIISASNSIAALKSGLEVATAAFAQLFPAEV